MPTLTTTLGIEKTRRECALRVVNDKFDAELILTSPDGASAHDKQIVHRYIEKQRSIELTMCEIDHCKRMIAMKALANATEGGWNVLENE